MYDLMFKQLTELLKTERNFIANASNFSSLIFHSLENVNWVGFYMMSGESLILSTFQGRTACVNIPIGNGVCGAAAKEMKTIIVDNVHQFTGHIACDSASNSEIVIPIIVDNKLIGVLDIDSPIESRFTADDGEKLHSLLEMLIESSDIKAIWNYYNS